VLDGVIKEYLERYMERLDQCPEILAKEIEAMPGQQMQVPLGEVVPEPQPGDESEEEAEAALEPHEPEAAAAEFRQFVEEHPLTPEQQHVLDEIAAQDAGLVIVSGEAGAGAALGLCAVQHIGRPGMLCSALCLWLQASLWCCDTCSIILPGRARVCCCVRLRGWQPICSASRHAPCTAPLGSKSVVRGRCGRGLQATTTRTWRRSGTVSSLWMRP
jgi:hypothetical protein